MTDGTSSDCPLSAKDGHVSLAPTEGLRYLARYSHSSPCSAALDEATQAWAASGEKHEDVIRHIDSNGAVLEAGDTVVLVKDLNVKGANFTAKRGTAVRGISLVADNVGQIEGRVEGQRIVILTRFVKKSN